MMEKRICTDCGGEFMGGDRALFCPECRNKHKHKRVTKICTTCGAEYVSTVFQSTPPAWGATRQLLI